MMWQLAFELSAKSCVEQTGQNFELAKGRKEKVALPSLLGVTVGYFVTKKIYHPVPSLTSIIYPL